MIDVDLQLVPVQLSSLPTALAHLSHASVAQSTKQSLMTTHCVSNSGQKLLYASVLCQQCYDASFNVELGVHCMTNFQQCIRFMT